MCFAFLQKGRDPDRAIMIALEDRGQETQKQEQTRKDTWQEISRPHPTSLPFANREQKLLS